MARQWRHVQSIYNPAFQLNKKHIKTQNCVITDIKKIIYFNYITQPIISKQIQKLG